MHADGGAVLLDSTYDASFVSAFKSQVPPSCRRWDKARRVWVIDPPYASHVADLCDQYLGVRPTVPAISTAAQAPLEQRLIQILYLGRCKERATGAEATATGFADGDWTVIFPESALRAWFEPTGQAEDVPATKGKPSTLYAVLMVTQQASVDELKAAYRRLARQLHPDVNSEDGAAEQFIALKHAYDVLSNEQQRRLYDAGLFFEQQSRQLDPFDPPYDRSDYRSPLRCGWVLCEGRSRLGVFVVSQICQWEDIVRADGAIMVSSWAPGKDHFETRYVAP